MTVNLLYTPDEKNKVGKTTTSYFTLTGTLREESSILTPSIIVNNVDDKILYRVNYMYIPDFHRYYFVTNITCVKNNLYRIDGRVDVLNTYASPIKAQTALIERQETITEQNPYLIDNLVNIQSNPIIITKNFQQTNPFDPSKWSYILLTIGSGGDIPESTEEVTANEQPLNQPNKTQSSQMEENT